MTITYKVIRVLEYVSNNRELLEDHLIRRGVQGVAVPNSSKPEKLVITETCITPIVTIEIQETSE